MSKKYYWLKLHKDFFKKHEIRIIEAMPNGKDYILFYLKLLVESVSHEGNLRFSDTIPYSVEMLSTLTDTNVDVVRSAMKVFTELEMIEVLDDETIFMSEVEKMIGSETDEHTREMNRLRQQRYRNSHKSELPESEDALHNVTVTLHRNAEIRDKSIENRDKNINYQEIINLYNDICISLPKVKTLSEKRKKAIKARLKTYSIDDLKKVFEKAEASSFLKGNNNSHWTANFDFLINDSNIAKVLDGNYDGKPMVQTSGKDIDWDNL